MSPSHLRLWTLICVFRRPVLCQIIHISPISFLQLISLYIFQYVAIVPLGKHHYFPSLAFIQKTIDDLPNPAQTICIVEDCFFCDSTVTNTYFFELIPERPDGDACQRHVAEIYNECCLLGMIWHHSIVVDHQHQVVIGVYYVLKWILEIDPVHPEHQDWLELLIESTCIDEPFLESFDRVIIKLSYHWIPMVIDDVFESG